MMQLATLALIFAGLSALAIGGASSTLPAMQQALVLHHHFITSAEFVRLFGLAQAAPGPNVLVVTLLGWRIAGLPGAGVATIAFLVPSSMLAFVAGRLWHRFRDHPWRHVLQTGLVPVTAGLMLAAGFLLARDAAVDLRSSLIASGVALATLLSRRHPLWFLGAAAVAGVL